MPLPLSKPVRVLLVDDHRVVREALAALLESEGVAVCSQADGRRQALDAVDAMSGERPDLAMVDLSLGEDDGIGLTADLHERGIRVVVCSTYEGPQYVRRALAAGARAYVTKREAGQSLAHAIREVLDGWVLISPGAADDLPDRCSTADSATHRCGPPAGRAGEAGLQPIP